MTQLNSFLGVTFRWHALQYFITGTFLSAMDRRYETTDYKKQEYAQENYRASVLDQARTERGLELQRNLARRLARGAMPDGVRAQGAGAMDSNR